MKKQSLILLTFAAAAMMMAAGCQKAELTPGVNDGEAKAVRVSATLSDGVVVLKSDLEPGNASEANRCVLQVFIEKESDYVKYGEPVRVAVTGKTADMGEVWLVPGHNYKLLFWADHTSKADLSQDEYYDLSDLPVVSLKDPSTPVINNDQYDAFSCVFSIDDGVIPESIPAVLHRALGQMNIVTTDIDKIPLDFQDMLVPKKVSLAYKENVPVAKNLFTGKVTGYSSAEITTAAAALPTATAPVLGGKYLAFQYIFADDDAQNMLPAFTINFLADDGTTPTSTAFELKSNAVPVQANWKTNVSGNLLTDGSDVTVTIDPTFNSTPITVSLYDLQLGNTTAADLTDKDVVLTIPTGYTGSATQLAVTAKTITLQGDATNNVITDANLKLIGTEGVTISNVNFKGKKVGGHPTVSITSDGPVVVEAIVWGQEAYNPIEINLGSSTGNTTSVIVRNCDFTGVTNVENNYISVFSMVDEGIIQIENCKFNTVTNGVRLSNETNAQNVTVNIVDCTYQSASNSYDVDYTGFLLMQDYTSADGYAAKQFSTWTINFENLMCGSTMITSDGSGEDQIYYMYYSNVASGRTRIVNKTTDPDQFPMVNFK